MKKIFILSYLLFFLCTNLSVATAPPFNTTSCGEVEWDSISRTLTCQQEGPPASNLVAQIGIPILAACGGAGARFVFDKLWQLGEKCCPGCCGMYRKARKRSWEHAKYVATCGKIAQKENEIEDIIPLKMRTSRAALLINIGKILYDNGWQRRAFVKNNCFLGYKYKKNNIPFIIDIRMYFKRKHFDKFPSSGFVKIKKKGLIVQNFDPSYDSNPERIAHQETAIEIISTRRADETFFAQIIDDMGADEESKKTNILEEKFNKIRNLSCSDQENDVSFFKVYLEGICAKNIFHIDCEMHGAEYDIRVDVMRERGHV